MSRKDECREFTRGYNKFAAFAYLCLSRLEISEFEIILSHPPTELTNLLDHGTIFTIL